MSDGWKIAVVSNPIILLGAAIVLFIVLIAAAIAIRWVVALVLLAVGLLLLFKKKQSKWLPISLIILALILMINPGEFFSFMEVTV